MFEQPMAMTPRQLRDEIRAERHITETSGLCKGFVQANLVILPARQADDFREFCRRNPKPCPVLEITAPGDPTIRFLAKDALITTDLPIYRIFQKGRLREELHDITQLWQEDFVGFLLGCSFTFENALIAQGIGVRNIADNHMVSHYRTSIPCAPCGVFSGSVVVTMRPVAAERVDEVYRITGKFPHVHGMPIYHGDPSAIGVRLDRPDWGAVTRMLPGEVPVFWACGVTPQVALENAKLDIAITHAPSCMFVSDIRDDDLEDRLAAQGAWD